MPLQGPHIGIAGGYGQVSTGGGGFFGGAHGQGLGAGATEGKVIPLPADLPLEGIGDLLLRQIRIQGHHIDTGAVGPMERHAQPVRRADAVQIPLDVLHLPDLPQLSRAAGLFLQQLHRSIFQHTLIYTQIQPIDMTDKVGPVGDRHIHLTGCGFPIGQSCGNGGIAGLYAVNTAGIIAGFGHGSDGSVCGCPGDRIAFDLSSGGNSGGSTRANFDNICVNPDIVLISHHSIRPFAALRMLGGVEGSYCGVAVICNQDESCVGILLPILPIL